MAREVIFEIQKLQFEFSEVFGAYGSSITPAPFVLTVGETYVINFRGTEYTRTAFSADSFITGAIGIGNEAFIGGTPDPDNLDLIIGYIPSNDSVAMLTSSSLDSHDIGIDIVVEDEILYGVSSKTLKSLANGVRSKTGVTGELVFPNGMIDAIPTQTAASIDLDFTHGGMVVTPDVGKVFNSVSVAKPAELVPENIAKDINIAGILGTHEGTSTNLIERTIEPFFKDCLFAFTDEEMAAILEDKSFVGKIVRYVGDSGSLYTKNQLYKVKEKYMNVSNVKYTSFGATAYSITTSINCNVNDLVVAMFCGLEATFPSGWTVIGSSKAFKEVNTSNTNNNRLTIAYTRASNTTVQLTVSHTSSSEATLTLVAFPDAYNVSFRGFQYQSCQNNVTSVAEFSKPNDAVIIWTVSSNYWTTATPYTQWKISNDSLLIQPTSVAPRMLVAIDTSDDSTVKFTGAYANEKNAFLCGAIAVDCPLTSYFVEAKMSDIGETEIHSVEAKDDTAFSKVDISRPSTLIPENIRSGVEISGIIGTYMAGDGDFNSSDPYLKYFYYRLLPGTKQIVLLQLLYDVLYEDQGNYDITIPDKMGGFDVVIALEGVI